MKRRVALICGVSGQDGAYLSKYLHDRGYTVVGTSRDATVCNRSGLRAVGMDRHVQLVSMAPNDFRSVLKTLQQTAPDEVYNLSGQTSVGLSFEQPVEAIESIAMGTLNLLESIRFTGRPIRLYNAGSSECFGDTNGRPADELTPFSPRSPYAVAKACAHNLVANYREAYGMYACTGILFNHESPLRPERFVTQKIVQTAARIAAGSGEKLVLGNTDISRDWGWAPEFVEAMYLTLQKDLAQDYVIATGHTDSLDNFVNMVFEFFKLSRDDHMEVSQAFLRPSDIKYGAANPGRAAAELNWQARTLMPGVVEKMCMAAREQVTG